MRARPAVAAIFALALHAPPVVAQTHWHGSADVNASFLQGSTDQRVVVNRGEVRHLDNTFELKGSFNFTYADIKRDSLPRYVDRRMWLGALNFDYHPHDRWSPFAILNYESSYEKRVLDRVGLGLGAKYTFIENDTSLANVSLAVLEERMRPSRRSLNPATVSIPRWSGRVRFRHAFNRLVTVSHTTFYQPRLTQARIYTVTSTSDFTFAVRKSVGLVASYLDFYDSQAQDRGARRNNDAQLTFGVRAGF